MPGNWFPKGKYNGDELQRFLFLRGYDWQRTCPEAVRCWTTTVCMNCLEPVAMSIRTIACKDDKYPQNAGLQEWIGKIPTDGYSTYAGGPVYCGTCLAIWRDPTKASNRNKDNVHG